MLRPNTVLVLADQHGHTVMGHTGHPDVQTPNLDRMAAEGVRFTKAPPARLLDRPQRNCL